MCVVCEILCVPVSLRESGCEKTSAYLLLSVCSESLLVCKQELRRSALSECVCVRNF